MLRAVVLLLFTFFASILYILYALLCRSLISTVIIVPLAKWSGHACCIFLYIQNVYTYVIDFVDGLCFCFFFLFAPKSLLRFHCVCSSCSLQLYCLYVHEYRRLSVHSTTSLYSIYGRASVVVCLKISSFFFKLSIIYSNPTSCFCTRVFIGFSCFSCDGAPFRLSYVFVISICIFLSFSRLFLFGQYSIMCVFIFIKKNISTNGHALSVCVLI